MTTDRKFIRNAQQAFRDALANGDLTMDTVGKWMYMYSDDNGDWFKHVDTREYVKFEGEIFTPETERMYFN